MEGAPKYVASEMCEVFNDHWGYAAEDLHYKAPGAMIRELVDCRRVGANMLMNVGPMGDGSIRTIDAATLEIMGTWVSYHEEAIRRPRPTGIEIDGKPDDFILRDGNCYYLFCCDLSMFGDKNVALAVKQNPEFYTDTFRLPEKIQSVAWMDNGESVEFSQQGSTVTVTKVPFTYGRSLVVRVAKIVC